MIDADFESILVPEDNGKQNPEMSFTIKYQKRITCSYGYKLVCVNYKFSKPFKTYLGKDTVYNFFNNVKRNEKKKYNQFLLKNVFSDHQ